jgi:hypothetical protein
VPTSVGGIGGCPSCRREQRVLCQSSPVMTALCDTRTEPRAELILVDHTIPPRSSRNSNYVSGERNGCKQFLRLRSAVPPNVQRGHGIQSPSKSTKRGAPTLGRFRRQLLHLRDDELACAEQILVLAPSIHGFQPPLTRPGVSDLRYRDSIISNCHQLSRRCCRRVTHSEGTIGSSRERLRFCARSSDGPQVRPIRGSYP